MCQLLGMNCNVPTDICFSFTGFQARGGLTDEHCDGCGIAFFEERGVRVFLDPVASVDSAVAELVRNYPIRSKNVIAHIRKATQGTVSLVNTHPFQRELWGHYWIFAHNGNLANFAPQLSGRFLPVGDTDSERAFCYLLDELARRFPAGKPEAQKLFDALKELSEKIHSYGAFNYLLCDGEQLFAHCSTNLFYVVRQAPFTTAQLTDQDISVDFSEVTSPTDRVAVIATLPLTRNETWTKMQPGELLRFVGGVAYQGSDVRDQESEHR